MSEKPSNGWIACSERLPEVDARVLLFVDYRPVGRTSIKVDWRTPNGWEYTDSPFVTHWMPMPPPPDASPAADAEGELVAAAKRVADALGFAEWCSPEGAEHQLQAIIKVCHGPLRAALAKFETRPACQEGQR